MATEQQIKELAFAMWEQEGRPEGKHSEHYLRAKQILEERDTSLALTGEQVTPLPTPAMAPLQSEPKLRGRKPRSKKS